MADIPSVPDIGFKTETAFRAIEELSAAYVNQVGVPDTKSGLNKSINAVLPGFYREALVEINEIMAGRTVPPGFSGLTGTKWLTGNNDEKTVGLADIAFLNIPAPVFLTLAPDETDLVSTTISLQSSTTPANNRHVFSIQNVRTGVEPVPAQPISRSLKTHRNLQYWNETAAPTADNGDLLVAFMCTFEYWPQQNNDIVLMSHRSFETADETGNSLRLGWEIGIGQPPGAEGHPQDRVLYYRHIDSGDAEVKVFAVDGAGAFISIAPNREQMLGFRRVGTDLQFHINGFQVANATLSAAPLAGTDGSVRLRIGGTYDFSKNSDSTYRQVTVWDTSLVALPTFDHLRTYYQVITGFAAGAP